MEHPREHSRSRDIHRQLIEITPAITQRGRAPEVEHQAPPRGAPEENKLSSEGARCSEVDLPAGAQLTQAISDPCFGEIVG